MHPRELAQEAGSQMQGAADMRICQTYHLDQEGPTTA